jgi:DNA-binding response OmpR family regulator
MKKNKFYTLLIVEDGEACTFLLKYKLQKSPEFKILHFRTAEEAIGSLHQNPDMVILDDKLPGMNGIMVLEAIRKRVCKIPVIILSTPNSSSDFLEFIRNGIYDYLIKEKDSAKLADKLIDRIIKILKQKESNDTDLQKLKILIAMVLLVLSIIVIFWLKY